MPSTPRTHSTISGASVISVRAYPVTRRVAPTWREIDAMSARPAYLWRTTHDAELETLIGKLGIEGARQQSFISRL